MEEMVMLNFSKHACGLYLSSYLALYRSTELSGCYFNL